MTKLRQWLREHPAAPAAPRCSAPADPLRKGASAALSRLEAAELEAAQAVSEAMASGDADAVEGARRWWLRCSEQLRRHDLAIEENRRAAGELIPREDCARILEGAAYFVRVAIRGAMDPLGQRLLREGTGDLRLVDSILDVVRFAAAAGLNHDFAKSGFPPWAKAAVLKGFDVPPTWLDKTAEVIARASRCAAGNAIDAQQPKE